MDVFSAFAAGDTSGNVFGQVAPVTTAGSDVAALVQAQGQKQLQTQVQAVASQYNVQLTDISDQQAKLSTVNGNINAAITKLQAANGSLGAVASTLNNMASTLTRASNSTVPPSTWAQTFQAQVSALNSIASGSGNMLGGTGPAVSYATTTNGGGVQTFLGDAMGSSYTIAASDGNVWAPNDSHTALVAYSAYPKTPAGKASTIIGGTTLNSLSGNSVNFTVNSNSASPTTLTGTLTPKGIGVLDSWMYDNFSTAAGRTRAQSDLTSAQGTVKAERARYGAAIAIAQYYASKTNLAMTALSDQQTAVAQQESDQINKLQQQWQQKQAALSLAMQGTAASSTQLADQLTTTSSSTDIFDNSPPDYPVFSIFA